MASARVNSCGSTSFSEYYLTLTGPTKARYRENVHMGGFDPYSLKKKTDYCEDVADYPSITFPDIRKLPGHPNLVENRARNEGLEANRCL